MKESHSQLKFGRYMLQAWERALGGALKARPTLSASTESLPSAACLTWPFIEFLHTV